MKLRSRKTRKRKSACDRAWVTAKQIENWSKMPKTTMWRRLNKLEEVGRICSVSDMKHCKLPTNNGRGHDRKRKELDSKTFTNDEIILGNFKGKDSLPLANRGNTFVSLRVFWKYFQKPNYLRIAYGRQLPRPLCGDGSKDSKKRIESH